MSRLRDEQTSPEHDDLAMLADALRKTMAAASGQQLDNALKDLGWLEMLDEIPGTAIPLVFKLLGETGAHAPILNDVLSREGDERSREEQPIQQAVPLPYAGGAWVVWRRTDETTSALDEDLPLSRVPSGRPLPLARGRVALGWWLVGTSRAMLSLARRHALDRTQFGRPVASFQAIRHKLAETLVAVEGAEATLAVADADGHGDELTCLLAKAAAGHAALTAARHCQQVLGGIGFTAEHELHRHVRRVFVLDGLLGSTRELTRQAGAELRSRGSTPRLVAL
ncbi:MAG TPA: acyl-CoA dehydrogenase family protein [Mycobacterium sp.]|jgi:hypothetical protein